MSGSVTKQDLTNALAELSWSINTQFAVIGDRFDGMSVKSENLTAKFDHLSAKVDGLDIQLGETNHRLERVESEVSATRNDLKEIYDKIY